MKLLETYANNASVDIKYPPNLPIQFFPLTAEKYITIQNSSGMPAKDYDLWQSVIDLIKPYLSANNIEIYQIGQGDVKPLNNLISLVNQTSFAQIVYILQNALLHAGNDSFACHAAYNTPVVALYGSTSVDAHSPYYKRPESVFIESHRWGRKPSFSAQEGPKTINLIKPEQVAKSILSILNIENNINQSTILVGDTYNQGSFIEVIPDFVLQKDAIAPGTLNLRGDLFYVPNLIIQNLQQRPYILWLRNELDINILKQLKPNIASIVFEIDENTNIEYLKSVLRAGIHLQLNTKISQESHNKLKLDYLDLPLIVRREDSTIEQLKNQIKSYNNIKSDEELEKFLAESIYNKDKEIRYFSRKHVLSIGKIYQGINQWRKQIAVENVEVASVADFKDQEFINEYNHFILYTNN